MTTKSTMKERGSSAIEKVDRSTCVKKASEVI